MKVLCGEHLSTSIWPGPKSISQETSNSCQMVLSWGEYQTNTVLLPPGEEGLKFPFVHLGKCPVASTSPNSEQCLLTRFCELGFAWWSKCLEWIKPEWACVCLRANHQLGPVLLLKSPYLFAVFSLRVREVGAKAGSEQGVTFRPIYFTVQCFNSWVLWKTSI